MAMLCNLYDCLDFGGSSGKKETTAKDQHHQHPSKSIAAV